MVLTIQDALGHIEDALGGPLVNLDPHDVLNEAGRVLLSLREWNWAKRPPTGLAFVAAQTWIALPADFGSIVSLTPANGLARAVQQTTSLEVQRYRSLLSMVPSYVYFVAVAHAPEAVTGIPKPRLEVYPTPGANEAGALQLVYRARWVDLSEDQDDLVPVPDWIESLYVQLVRATAWGYLENDMGMHLAKVINNPLWNAAGLRDSAQQHEHGALSGGALSMSDDGGGEWPRTWSGPISPS